MKNIIILLSFLISANVFGADTTPQQYWNMTDITVDSLEQVVNTTNCYQGKQKLIGCFYAVAAFARDTQANPYLNFFPTSFVSSHPEIKIQVLELGPGYTYGENVTKPDPSAKPKGLFEELADQKKNSIDLENKITDLLQAPNKIPFTKIIDKLVKSIKDPQDLKLSVGDAINDYLHQAFDPHTNIDPVTLMQDMMKPNNDFAGLGISITTSKSGIIVTQFLNGSVAEQDGMKLGDRIVVVQGPKGPVDATKGTAAAVAALRGEPDTKVTLDVFRKNQTITLTITRKKITVKKFESRVIADEGKSYGYVKFADFMSQDLCNNFYDALSSLEKQKVSGFIIDLRGNGGGIAQQASCLASYLVGFGQAIVVFKDPKTNEIQQVIGTDISNNGKMSSHDQIYFDRPMRVFSQPLVVLTDARSASASEILAGTLQDYDRAWVVGENSFGKGSAQNMMPSDSVLDSAKLGNKGALATINKFSFLTKGLYLRETDSRFFLPRGWSTQIIGVTPDFVAPFKSDATLEERYAPREADIFTNPLTQVTPRPEISADRKMRIANINMCRDRQVAQKIEKAQMDSIGYADYQLLAGQEVLNCAAEVKGSPLLISGK